MSKGRSVSNTVSNIRTDNRPPPIHLTGFQRLRIHGHFPPSPAGKFAPYEYRDVVKLSTGIRIADDPKGVRAAAAVARLNAATEQYWADRAAGFDVEALRRYEANVAQSVAFGFEPISQRKLLALTGCYLRSCLRL